MPGGGKLTIAISTLILKERTPEHIIDKPGAYALVSVSDTGSGIDEQIREKIFEPFFTTKETGKGTGLGLSIVYGIIKQHNGFITVHSEPGMGTMFKLYLPLVGIAGSQRRSVSLQPDRKAGPKRSWWPRTMERYASSSGWS